MREFRDCLTCGNSLSADGENGEHILYCVVHDKFVDEEETCEDYG
ncbi:hypothetical protein [Paenibacillus sp. NAIST15-1]|nr:hypothetical protein [Paenibacillus sp. NAIST15-1]GAV11425.1 hypothetical protein PBN151_1354 [Paenibacillus sp. NAIST15-1]